MGDWSVAWHWFECPSMEVAERVAARLARAGERRWVDPDGWRVGYGFVGRGPLVQASSTVKWGWEQLSDLLGAGFEDVDVIESCAAYGHLAVDVRRGVLAPGFNFLVQRSGAPFDLRACAAALGGAIVDVAPSPVVALPSVIAFAHGGLSWKSPQQVAWRRSPVAPVVRSLVAAAPRDASRYASFAIGLRTPEHGCFYTGELQLEPDALRGWKGARTDVIVGGDFNPVRRQVKLGPVDWALDADNGMALPPDDAWPFG